MSLILDLLLGGPFLCAHFLTFSTNSTGRRDRLFDQRNGPRGHHVSGSERFRWRVKGDCQNEANSKTVGNNRNFGIAH
jgi:hypothetical protein